MRANKSTPVCLFGAVESKFRPTFGSPLLPVHFATIVILPFPRSTEASYFYDIPNRTAGTGPVMMVLPRPGLSARLRLGSRCRAKTWVAARRLRVQLRPKGSTWHMDETFVRIAARLDVPFRAVDSGGQTVDFYSSKTRDREAANCFLRQALAFFV